MRAFRHGCNRRGRTIPATAGRGDRGGPKGGGGAGREELPALRPQPGPVAAAVTGGVAAGEAPGPLRERTGGGGTESERDPRGLHRGARLPALRPAPDGQAADLRLLHGPALVASDREALLGRRRLPLPGGWGGAGLPIDRALSTSASGGDGRPLPAGTAAMPTGGDGTAGQGGTGRDQAAGERQPAQGHELQADGGAGGAAGGGDRRDAGRGGAGGSGRGRALRSRRTRRRPAGGAEPARGPAAQDPGGEAGAGGGGAPSCGRKGGRAC